MKSKNERYIPVGSITYAIKAKKVLEKKGIKSYIIRDFEAAEGYGCGYVLKINGTDETVESVKNILIDEKIKF